MKVASFPGRSHHQYFIASSMKYGVFHTGSDEILVVGTAWEQGCVKVCPLKYVATSILSSRYIIYVAIGMLGAALLYSRGGHDACIVQIQFNTNYLLGPPISEVQPGKLSYKSIRNSVRSEATFATFSYTAHFYEYESFSNREWAIQR